jgi:hypothetical protein
MISLTCRLNSRCGCVTEFPFGACLFLRGDALFGCNWLGAGPSGTESRFLKFDLVPHITSAQEFVTTGRLPDRALLAVSLPTYHQEQPGF